MHDNKNKKKLSSPQKAAENPPEPPRFNADAPGQSPGEAAQIARNSRAAEKKRQAETAQSSAERQAAPNAPGQQQPAAAKTKKTSLFRHYFELALRHEHEAFETDRKMASILTVLSKQFSREQILVMPWRKAFPFLLLGWLCVLIQTLSMNMFQNNVPLLEGYFHTTTTETLWLISAYMAPYASFTILLIKLRTQFGMRRFTITSLVCFLICCFVSLFVQNFETALIIRFFAGLTTAPISAIGFLHTFEVFTPTRKVTIGISLNMLYMALGMPAARIVGTYLLADSHAAYFYLLEVGLTSLVLALMYYIHITPLPQANVLEKMDFISYPLMALGLGLNAAMMPVGRYYWWQDAPWMGWIFALSLVCLTAALLIELNRKTPLIDFRWLFSWDMLHITLVMLTFRILISDQSSLLGTYFSLFGLQNENLIELYLWTAAGTILGGLICMATLRVGGGDYLYLIGALVIAYGSFSDSFSTNLTRPQDMFLSQMLIGFGTALFMAVSMCKGMTAAFARGNPISVLTFIAAFLFTQSTGGIIGSAFFGTIQTYLEKFHSVILTQHLVLSDPAVAARIAANSQIYSGIINDSSILQAEGIASLGRQATLEANILAYNDIFRIYGYIAVILFCLLAVRLLFKAHYLVFRGASGKREETPA